MSNNHLQLSYSTIDNILTNLLPAGLQDFFQVANVSNGTMMANKLMEWKSTVLGLSLGYSAALPIRCNLQRTN